MRALEKTTKLLRSATLLGALAGACTAISLPCLGQENDRALPEVDERRPQMWSGRWLDRLPPEGDPGRRATAEAFAEAQKAWCKATAALVEREGPQAYAEALLRDVAGAFLDYEVGAIDAAGYQRELAALVARASRAEDYPGRWDVLRRIKLELGRFCDEAGHPDAALFNTSRLLFPAGAILPPYELVPASDALLAQEAEALKDPGLEAFRSSVMQASAPAPAAVAPAQDSDLERKVRDALSMSQWGLVEELGSYAAEALAAIVAESPDELPARERDALYWLFKYGELRGARLVLDLWDRTGIYFRKRVLRGIREAGVLSNPGTWTFVPMPKGTMQHSTQAPRMEEPVWLDVLARLLADPEVARDSLGPVGYVAMLDGLDQRLQRGLMDALDRGDPDMVKDVLAALERTQGRASVVPVLEHALEHPDAKVRVFAAERLALYPRNDALRRHADDTDPRIRRAVAGSLSGRTGQASYREDGNAFWTTDTNSSFLVAHTVDERDLPCVTRLLQDPDPDIRASAVEALVWHPDLSPPSDLLVRLARDSSPDVRRQLARWRAGRPADPALLEVLAADSDAGVLEELDRRFEDLATTSPSGEAVQGGTALADPKVEVLWSDAYLPALTIRVANLAPDFHPGAATLVVAGRTTAGARALVEAAVARGDWFVRVVLDAMAESQSVPAPAQCAWKDVPAADLAALVGTSWSVDSDQAPEQIRRALWNWTPTEKAPLRSLMRDPSLPLDLRAYCARATAGLADAAWRQDLLVLMEQVGAGDAASREGSRARGFLRDLPRGLPLEDLWPVLADVTGREGLSGEVVGSLLGLYGAWGPTADAGPSFPPGLALALLERFGGERWDGRARDALGAAVRGLPLSVEEPRLELVRGLLGNPWIVVEVLEALGRAHLPQYLPLLEDALLGRGHEGGYTPQVQSAAAAALASYLSDEAAEVLLKGLGATTDEGVRKACFDALDTIRRYQDEKERWEQRKSSLAAREAAIAELVPMLADADANVRAQAARSLGALGAVEQLPTLVRLLKDPVPQVRAAAQEAIDALTRPALPGEKD